MKLLTVTAVLTCACTIACAPNSPLAEADKRREPRTVTIPLESIYLTCRQEGPIYISPSDADESFRVQFEELYQCALDMGASNVFLTRGDRVGDAIAATAGAFIHRRSADGPVFGDPRQISDHFWFAAHLGVASGHDAWDVESGCIKDNLVRLTFTQPRRETVTRDLNAYLCWFPLGRLSPGTYTLELFDKGKGQVVLTRRVTISEP
jgi:hypothetical protein